MADITTIFWGSPLVFWCVVGLWILMFVVIFVKFLLGLESDGEGDDGDE